ncbi:MAG: hypothetical protein WBE13_23590 [Candidatus Acidiferrum sp.]
MKIALELNEELIRKVRQIADERGMTLDDLVRVHLELLTAEVANQPATPDLMRALERSFKEVTFSLGKRTWTRADLHERS